MNFSEYINYLLNRPFPDNFFAFLGQPFLALIFIYLLKKSYFIYSTIYDLKIEKRQKK